MELTVANRGITEDGTYLEVGDKVRYLSHIPGGMVKIRLRDGTETVAHPLCFSELR